MFGLSLSSKCISCLFSNPPTLVDLHTTKREEKAEGLSMFTAGRCEDWKHSKAALAKKRYVPVTGQRKPFFSHSFRPWEKIEILSFRLESLGKNLSTVRIYLQRYSHVISMWYTMTLRLQLQRFAKKKHVQLSNGVVLRSLFIFLELTHPLIYHHLIHWSCSGLNVTIACWPNGTLAVLEHLEAVENASQHLQNLNRLDWTTNTLKFTENPLSHLRQGKTKDPQQQKHLQDSFF